MRVGSGGGLSSVVQLCFKQKSNNGEMDLLAFLLVAVVMLCRTCSSIFLEGIMDPP